MALVLGQKPSLGDFAPQASQGPATAMSTHQNVTFTDAEPGHIHDSYTELDSTRQVAMPQEVPMGDFLSRPQELAAYTWTAGGPIFHEILYPWDLFMNHPTVQRRIANYRLFQGTLCLKIVLNGNSFLYGRLIASYIPLVQYDALTRWRSGVNADFVGASQKPHIYLDPCTSQGGEMRLPYLNPFQASDVVLGDYSVLGALQIADINRLQHSSGASDEVTIRVYGWLENVKLSVPTDFEPISAGVFEPQADEYGVGAVSRPASTIAAIASRLVSAPVIGPFARATEIAASATSKIASVFGYSRPPMVTSSIYRPLTKASIAVSNMEDDVQKLSLDVKQELSIDPRIDGACGEDPFDVKSIAQHESYLKSFTWEEGQARDSLLQNFVVTPGLFRVHGSGDNVETHLPACAYAVLPFKYWRGTMKFRFQVVCSKFHRGRLRFVYDPYGASVEPPDYNKVYSTVVDISESTDFMIECGWGQTTLWRQSNDYTNTETTFMRNTPLFWSPFDDPWGNGVLSVYIVNELTTPSDVSTEIEINTFVSVGDDFEVAVPTAEWISRLRVSNPGGTIGPNNADSLEFQPQAMEEDQADAPIASTNPDAPEATEGIRLAPETDPVDYTHAIHFGEVFKSFRPLLKRYMAHETIPVDVTGGNTTSIQIWRWALPFVPGIVNSPAAPATSPLVDTIDGKYAYGYMTHLRYLTLAHVGWKGGVRWLVDLTGFSCCNQASTLGIATRSTGCRPTNQFFALGNPTVYPTNAATRDVLVAYKDYTGLEGAMVHHPVSQPVANFEVPYYSIWRFAPSRASEDFETFTGSDYMPCWKYGISIDEGGKWGRINTMCAAAEDFSVSFFVGAPPFYLELIPPGTV